MLASSRGARQRADPMSRTAPLSDRCVTVFVFALVAALLAPAPRLAADAPRPNVILIIGDDISADDFGCYGNPVARTPHVDRLAAGGIRFTQAFLTASSCSPSRSSIATGRYPHNNGAASELHRPIAWNLPRFPAVLRAHGYHTALSGKNHMTQEKPPAGQSAQPEPFDVIDNGQVPGNHGGHGKWVQHLRDRPAGKPFFLWFAALDAHRGWEADAEWDEAEFGPKHDPARVRVPPYLVDDAATRQDLASHANEVTRFDHYIGRVVAELERQRILEHTLILVLADNAGPFPRAKTRLHDSGMQTALIAHWPAGIAQPGVARHGLVSAIDLAPTILEVAGAPALPTVQGRSLRPMFRAPAAGVRRFAFSEHNWHDYAANARAAPTNPGKGPPTPWHPLPTKRCSQNARPGDLAPHNRTCSSRHALARSCTGPKATRFKSIISPATPCTPPSSNASLDSSTHGSTKPGIPSPNTSRRTAMTGRRANLSSKVRPSAAPGQVNLDRPIKSTLRALVKTTSPPL